MPIELENVSERALAKVRWWRRGFQGAYLSFAAIIIAWLVASMFSVHCGLHQDPARLPVQMISATADNPAQLRSCNRKLERLMDGLRKQAIVLQRRTLKYKLDPKVEWRNWSEAWRRRWDAVGRRCRFGELGGRGVSQPLDMMSAIHRELGELERSYGDFINSFAEQHVERLRRLSREIAAVNEAIGGRHRPTHVSAPRPSGG